MNDDVINTLLQYVTIQHWIDNPHSENAKLLTNNKYTIYVKIKYKEEIKG